VSIPVKFKRLHPNAKAPTYGSEQATGADLYAIEDAHVYPGEVTVVGTGIALDLSPFTVDKCAIQTGLDVQVRSRSGLAAKHGIVVLNSPGTIDLDYTGEIKVILFNHGTRSFDIKAGDRIAQIVLGFAVRLGYEEVEDLPETARADGGLGSTGR